MQSLVELRYRKDHSLCSCYTCACLLSCYVLIFVSYDFGRGYDFTIQENGLQIDQPPVTGNVSIVQIIIMENDNVEGIIEFDPKYTAISGELTWLVLMITAFSELQRNMNFYMHAFV